MYNHPAQMNISLVTLFHPNSFEHWQNSDKLLHVVTG